MSRGWKIFFASWVVIIVGPFIGVCVGYFQIDNDISEAIAAVRKDASSYLSGKSSAVENQLTDVAKNEAGQLSGLNGPYVQIKSKQLSTKSPLIGPIESVVHRGKWRASFFGHLDLLNTERAHSGKAKLEVKVEFVDPDTDSRKASLAKDWPADRTVNWVAAHSQT